MHRRAGDWAKNSGFTLAYLAVLGKLRGIRCARDRSFPDLCAKFIFEAPDTH